MFPLQALFVNNLEFQRKIKVQAASSRDRRLTHTCSRNRENPAGKKRWFRMDDREEIGKDLNAWRIMENYQMMANAIETEMRI